MEQAEAAARRHVVRGALARLGGWREPWQIAREAGYGIHATQVALRDLRSRGHARRRQHEDRRDMRCRPLVEYRLP